MTVLVDTGPLIALFDPAEPSHPRCRKVFEGLREPVVTTVPVLTEAFHLLEPKSVGAEMLRGFVGAPTLPIFHLDDSTLERSLELMQQYARLPMDFADASLVAAAEALRARTVFTLDRRDFSVYRATLGHTKVRFKVVP